ncbi:MAG: hypothetical protein ACP5OV_07030 [Acidimicrobiales bacterium]
MAGLALLAALFPLDHLGHYIHWGWVYISDANAIVIALMVIVFIAALLVPFPGHGRRKESR